ncbi:hypothetical protein R3P38DRAFT_891760 [Favolaschia claudopus]|uniref:Uncharacterized protein n=1 Tax=Favolaschia claudopus TaxID=2862362 RepID=A0AAW0BUR6_9AGAR
MIDIDTSPTLEVRVLAVCRWSSTSSNPPLALTSPPLSTSSSHFAPFNSFSPSASSASPPYLSPSLPPLPFTFVPQRLLHLLIHPATPTRPRLSRASVTSCTITRHDHIRISKERPAGSGSVRKSSHYPARHTIRAVSTTVSIAILTSSYLALSIHAVKSGLPPSPSLPCPPLAPASRRHDPPSQSSTFSEPETDLTTSPHDHRHHPHHVSAYVKPRP